MPAEDMSVEDATEHEWPSDVPLVDGVPAYLPDWWLFVAGRGMTATDEQQTALRRAHRIITRYRGPDGAPETARIFTRAVVRDALHAAPQPISDEWVRYSLAIILGIAVWCHDTAQPMSREHVLDPHTRHRFLHSGAKTLSQGASKTYQSRLDIISNALLTPPNVTPARPTWAKPDKYTPYTPAEETALWAWSRGLRPVTRRQRIQAGLAIGFGTGLARKDVIEVRGGDVFRDERGVHVIIRSARPGDALTGTAAPKRIVTCLREWEDDLWQLALPVGTARLLVGPWDSTLVPTTLDQTIHVTNQKTRPPVPVTLTRLRHTWIVRHLTLGTPLPVLMDAAGLRTVDMLQDLLRFVPAYTAEQTATALRADQ